MAVTDRVRLGGTLVWRSLRVVAVHKRLVVYPLLSWASLVGATAMLLAVFSGTSVLPRLVPAGGQLGYWLGLADVVVALLAGGALTTLFNAGLANNTIRSLREENPRVRDGLYSGLAAWDRVVVWGLVSSTVGPLAHAVERLDRSGTVVETLFGGPWSTATFFALPVLAFEGARLGRLFERSRQLYRKSWGYTAGASLGVDLALALVAAPLAVVGVYARTADLAAPTADGLAAIAAVGLLVVLLVRQVAAGVSKGALYVYATTGRTPKAYTGVDFSTVAWHRGEGGE